MSVPKPKRFHSLSTRVAAWILGMVAVLVGWQIYWVQYNELREVEHAARERVVHDMVLLQTALEFALAAGATAQVDRELSARGADLSLDALVLVDDTGRVIGASLRHEVGLPLEEALGEAPPADMMDAARARQVGGVRLSPDGRRIHATWPVVFGVKPGQIRAERVGVIVAIYDLDLARAQVQVSVRRRTGEMVLVSLALVAAFLVFGQVYFGRRVRALVAATERLAAGDFETRAAVTGADELGLISGAFDTMAARIGETQRHLTESEARFRTLVEAAPVGILRIDPLGHVVDSNVAWREMAGPDGRAWPAHVHVEDRERVRQEWAEASAAGRMPRAECRLVRPDGSVVWVQVQGVPEPGVPHGPPGFIITAVDLTRRRDAEAHRARLEAQLLQAQKLEALGALASGVAHDFKNILAVVLGHAELLAQLIAGQPKAEGHVRRVLEAAQRGGRMVQEILEFGRPGVRRLREVRMEALVADVARVLGPSLPANVVLRVSVAPDVPPIGADPDQLHRMLVNLGTNAWQAMQPDGGVLEIGARRHVVDDAQALDVPGLPTGPAVVLWVRDEGCGMDEATRTRIFEPFFSTKPYGEGTGLGLAVVHGIVRAHGGGIVVESEVGRGTTFSIYLPVTPLAPIPEAPAVGAAPVPTTAPRILYVEDDEALLELAEHAFRRRGYQVACYADPLAALTAFRANPAAYDIVVTDQRMPHMLGEQLVAALAEARPDLPIVLMSGHVTNEEAVRIRALGASAVVDKPMSIDEVVALCSRVLAGSV